MAKQIHYRQLLDVMPEWIFIDMDGTLVLEELTRDYVLHNIRQAGPFKKTFNPVSAIYYLSRLLIDRLALKLDLAKHINEWSYNQQLIDILAQYRGCITLITGSCETLGQRVASGANKLLAERYSKLVTINTIEGSICHSEETSVCDQDQTGVPEHAESTIDPSKAEDRPQFNPSIAPAIHSVIGSRSDLDCIGLQKLEIMKKLTSNPFYIGNSSQDIPILQNCSGCLITSKPRLLRQLPADSFFIRD